MREASNGEEGKAYHHSRCTGSTWAWSWLGWAHGGQGVTMCLVTVTWRMKRPLWWHGKWRAIFLHSPYNSWSFNLTSLTTLNHQLVQLLTSQRLFDLTFTPSFMDDIVEQSNFDAKQVIGIERYTTWEKTTRPEPTLGFAFSWELLTFLP